MVFNNQWSTQMTDECSARSTDYKTLQSGKGAGTYGTYKYRLFEPNYENNKEG